MHKINTMIGKLSKTTYPAPISFWLAYIIFYAYSDI